MGKKPETKEVRTPRVHAFRVLQSVACFVMDMPEKGPAREIWRGRVTNLTVSLKKAPDTEVPEILSEAVRPRLGGVGRELGVGSRVAFHGREP